MLLRLNFFLFSLLQLNRTLELYIVNNITATDPFPELDISRLGATPSLPRNGQLSSDFNATRPRSGSPLRHFAEDSWIPSAGESSITRQLTAVLMQLYLEL